MTTVAREKRHDYVLRDTRSIVTFWVAVAVLAFLAGDLVVRGVWPELGFALPLALFLAWALWLMLYRPRIRYDAERVIVINITRVHVLPWSRVTAVRQRLNPVFELDDGRMIVASGSTASRGASSFVRGATGRVKDDPAEFNRIADTLDAMRTDAADTGAVVESRWDLVPLAIGAVLAIAVVVDLIIAFH